MFTKNFPLVFIALILLVPLSACGTVPSPSQSYPPPGAVNVAVGKPVIAQAGGVDYEPWGHANNAADFNTTTKADGGRWGNETNNGGGTYQVVDLGQPYEIAGVGYRLDWDAAFKNPLTFVVEVSNDQESWVRVSNVTYPYDGVHGTSTLDIKMIPIAPVKARYIKFWEPPDGAWNGWGDFFALRVYASPQPSYPSPVEITMTPDYRGTVAVAIARTQTAVPPTPDLQATIAAGVAATQTVRAFVPNPAILEDTVNVAIGKPVIARAGGVNYASWQQANDAADFGTTTKATGGRWANETNTGGGTYQIVDLGQPYEIVGVGYRLDWDAAFKNPLTFVVEVSNDQESWTRVSDTVYPYDGTHGSSILDVKIIPINPVEARFVKFWEPPDGAWNGWGDIYALRVYAYQ
jgi:hypothetical protein